MPVQASIRLLALVLRRPNHILANPLVPVMFCDYDYEETNYHIKAGRRWVCSAALMGDQEDYWACSLHKHDSLSGHLSESKSNHGNNSIILPHHTSPGNGGQMSK